MTTFPSLIPSTRVFTPGIYPHTAFAVMSGRSNRVRHSNAMLESQVRLSYQVITEAEMLSILTHYRGQRGDFQSFLLPSAVWLGVSAINEYQLNGYGWIYKGPPQVEDLPCGHHNVMLTLESVPPEGTALIGLEMAVRYLLAGGVVDPGGLSRTITYSLSPGAVQITDALGMSETIAYSLAAGSVDPAGLAEVISYSLAAGSVAGDNPILALSPVLWYDFDDASTVTLSGSTITAISDKGSRGWTLSKSATGPVQATWTNNAKKCVDWGSSSHSNYLRNTDSTSTNIAEIYVVLDAAFGSTFPSYNGLISSAADGSFFVAGSSGDTGFFSENAVTFNAAYINGSTSNVYSSGVLTAINSPCVLRIRNTSGAAIATTGGFQIGMDRGNGGRGWYGLIGEVVCFSTVLNSTDRAAVEAWLADKWSITI